MRVIGHVDNETGAKRFGDFLYVQGITNTVERDDNSWVIWVHDDDQLATASEWLTKFRANPSDPQFVRSTEAEKKRADEKKDLADYQKRFHTRSDLFRNVTPYGVGKLTALLIAISVGVFILSRFGTNEKSVMPLFITDWWAQGNYIEWMPGLPEIHAGQIWRLITPMFLHFGFFHIAFNMMAMFDFGSMIEGREGTGRFMMLVIFIAALSNFAQYAVTGLNISFLGGGPVFGGMSGVVYGLLGYIWMRGRMDPACGLFLHRSIVTVAIVWMVLGFTNSLGFIGHMANTVHLVGFVTGIAFGALFSLRAFRR